VRAIWYKSRAVTPGRGGIVQPVSGTAPVNQTPKPIVASPSRTHSIHHGRAELRELIARTFDGTHS
jgi:hypothetical protein